MAPRSPSKLGECNYLTDEAWAAMAEENLRTIIAQVMPDADIAQRAQRELTRRLNLATQPKESDPKEAPPRQSEVQLGLFDHLKDAEWTKMTDDQLITIYKGLPALNEFQIRAKKELIGRIIYRSQRIRWPRTVVRKGKRFKIPGTPPDIAIRNLCKLLKVEDLYIEVLSGFRQAGFRPGRKMQHRTDARDDNNSTEHQAEFPF